MIEQLVSSGVSGLDYLVGGGFPAHRIYLVHGPTGSGKTTIGLQFALAGANAGEATLYVALAETLTEMSQIAASHGWNLEGINLFAPQAATLASEGKRGLHPLSSGRSGTGGPCHRDHRSDPG